MRSSTRWEGTRGKRNEKVCSCTGGIGAAGWPVLNGLGDTPSQTKPLFTSLHPGVVMFATADGAGRGLAFTIEQKTLNSLAGMADGEVL